MLAIAVYRVSSDINRQQESAMKHGWLKATISSTARGRDLNLPISPGN
jgi:hypothetical protein